jgi:hypothetical protein
MTASPSPPTLGNNITFTATVQPIRGITPTGNVSFSETVDMNNHPLPNIIYYGNADLDSTGTATFTVTPSSKPKLTAGTHVLVATYGGAHYNGATSPNVRLTVNPSLGQS